MCKAIRLFTIAVVIMLSACTPQKPTDYSNEVRNVKSEQVIEYYINAWNENHSGKMNAVLSDEMKTRTFYYDSTDTVRIVSIEPTSINELPSTVKGLQEVTVYRVEISIQRQHNNSTQAETSTAFYYVGKETESSPWLIYDIQKK